MNWLQHLQTFDSIWRPWAFDRVEIKGRTKEGTKVHFSLIGKCYSKYQSGPSSLHCAEVAGEIYGPGFYGLSACRAIGYRS